MPLHDVNYKHWQGEHLNVWGRRWVIARNGLTACLQMRFMTSVVVICWGMGLAAAGLLFLVGQLLVADSVVVRWISTVNPNLQLFANLLTLWLKNHPELSVGTTQNVLFYYFGHLMEFISIFLLGPIIPLLITRDLSSNAIVIYSSKAITRGDYFIGKFATAFGFLTLTWLGPVLVAWFLGNLLSPDWAFFWHARGALANILIYGVSSMTILSILALGVSAVSRKDLVAVALWFIWWIVGSAVSDIAIHTEQPWLQHIGFNFNLGQIALSTFRVGDNIRKAAGEIPVLSEWLAHGIRSSTMARYETPHLGGTVVALAIMLGLAAWLLHKRVKPE